MAGGATLPLAAAFQSTALTTGGVTLGGGGECARHPLESTGQLREVAVTFTTPAAHTVAETGTDSHESSNENQSWWCSSMLRVAQKRSVLGTTIVFFFFFAATRARVRRHIACNEQQPSAREAGRDQRQLCGASVSVALRRGARRRQQRRLAARTRRSASALTITGVAQRCLTSWWAFQTTASSC